MIAILMGSVAIGVGVLLIVARRSFADRMRRAAPFSSGEQFAVEHVRLMAIVVGIVAVAMGVFVVVMGFRSLLA